MEESGATPPQRRVFLFWLLGGLSGVLAATATWPVLRYLAPRQSDLGATSVTIPVDRVPVGVAHFFDFRGHPAVLVQSRPGTFVAMSAVCTHLGCIVKWVTEKQQFLCPCHGGQFSATGVVLGGPPPKALEIYPVSRSGDQLRVG